MTTVDYSLGAFEAPVAPAPIVAAVELPGSKSLTARELVLAACADGPARVIRPLHSDDSRHMVAALRTLGATFTPVEGSGAFGHDWEVTPISTFRSGTIDGGQAGTVMRFVTPLAGLAAGDSLITAHETALHRPMGGIIRTLREIGVDIADGGTWSLPFTVAGRGHIRGGEASVDASASSQFISGLLLAAPRFDVGLQLKQVGDRLPSMPHIEMTVEALTRRGVAAARVNTSEWVVQPGPIRAIDVEIEPDLSNAAPFLAAALVTGGAVSIGGWPSTSTQPGIRLPELLAAFGASSELEGSTLTVRAGARISGVDLDLSAVSELTPTLAGLAAFADAPSTFTGIGHIRDHETDRIAALVENLAAVGTRAEELEDGIRVFPGAVTPGMWQARHDHRIATTGALIGLRTPGVVIDDIRTTAKTLPEFPKLWQELVGADVE